MALTPLEIEITNKVTGIAVEGATFEMREGLEGTKPNMPWYDQAGFVVEETLTDDEGSAKVWIPNSLVEWRVTGTYETRWRSFRAWAGFGAEGHYESGAVGVATPTSSTITVPSHGIDDLIGGAEVKVDFSHDHLAKLIIMLVRGSEALLLSNAIVQSSEPGVSLEVEYRNPLTGASPTIYDSGGSVITPPYMTDSATGNFEGYARRGQGLVQWRIVDSTMGFGYENYGQPILLGGISLFDGTIDLSLNGVGDQAFDGTLTFSTRGSDWSSGNAIIDGQRISLPSEIFSGNSIGAGDDWKLAVADLADPSTTGQLDAWYFDLIPV